jgi:hypothetical protein
VGVRLLLVAFSLWTTSKKEGCQHVCRLKAGVCGAASKTNPKAISLNSPHTPINRHTRLVSPIHIKSKCDSVPFARARCNNEMRATAKLELFQERRP